MRGAIVAALLAIFTAALSSQTPSPSYDDLVRLYRAGSFERTSSELRSRPLTEVDGRAMQDWCRARTP
jgi:hypothetical protein